MSKPVTATETIQRERRAYKEATLELDQKLKPLRDGLEALILETFKKLARIENEQEDREPREWAF